jgi:hypothetical protein
VVHHRADRADGKTVAERLAHVDDEDGEPVRLLLHLFARRGSREEQHEVGMLGAARPDLLAVHDVGFAVAPREGAERRGVRAARRLRHAEGLQAQRPACDLRQVALFLLVRAVAEDRAHRVELRVAGGAVAALRVDRLQDGRGHRKPEPGAAVLLRDQDGEVARLGQRGDELGRIGALAVEPAPVLAGEARAELRDLLAYGFACIPVVGQWTAPRSWPQGSLA